MYNNYEEYMQSVLGVNMPNTYAQMGSNNYYEPRMQETNIPEVNKLYPEIYRIVYPMVQKACGRGNINIMNEVQINEIVEEVYNAIEPGDDIVQGNDNANMLRNGDVKNPRVKEQRRPNNNYLLRDLIRILIIRELLQGGGSGSMPPRPPMGPGMPGPGGRPPVMRPGFMGMY